MLAVFGRPGWSPVCPACRTKAASARRTQSASHTRSSKLEVMTAAIATRTAMIRSFKTSRCVLQHPVQLLDRRVGGALALELNLDIHLGIVRMPYPHHRSVGADQCTHRHAKPHLAAVLDTSGALAQRYSFAWPMSTSRGNRWGECVWRNRHVLRSVKIGTGRTLWCATYQTP
jgi:hypothetical protein